jgi:hypothetical protein
MGTNAGGMHVSASNEELSAKKEKSKEEVTYRAETPEEARDSRSRSASPTKRKQREMTPGELARYRKE